VIQEWWPDSRRGHRCGRAKTAPVTTAAVAISERFDDDEWGLVEPLIPPGKTGGGKRTVIMREVVKRPDVYSLDGCQWRAIRKTAAEKLGLRLLRSVDI